MFSSVKCDRLWAPRPPVAIIAMLSFSLRFRPRTIAGAARAPTAAPATARPNCRRVVPVAGRPAEEDEVWSMRWLPVVLFEPGLTDAGRRDGACALAPLMMGRPPGGRKPLGGTARFFRPDAGGAPRGRGRAGQVIGGGHFPVPPSGPFLRCSSNQSAN